MPAEKTPFEDSRQCRSGKACKECRDLKGGVPMRKAILSWHTVPAAEEGQPEWNFPCVLKTPLPWGFVKIKIVRKPKEQKRPWPGVAAALSAIKATFLLPKVLEAERAEREATCQSCPMVRQDKIGLWCSVCGCGVGKQKNRVPNLAARQEAIRAVGGGRLVVLTGCKHPDRMAGKGWPLPALPETTPPPPAGPAVDQEPKG